MDLTRYADPAAFASRAQPFLLRHEAEHNLILGLVGALQRQPVPGRRPYLAILEEGGEVLAVALRTPPNRLVLSRTGSSVGPPVGPPVRTARPARGPPDAPPEEMDKVVEEALQQLVADLAGRRPGSSPECWARPPWREPPPGAGRSAGAGRPGGGWPRASSSWTP